jgi:ABC-2 type transport system permease protein
LRLARAFVWRDLLVMRSYRLQFLLQILGMVFTLATYAFLAQLVPGRLASLRVYGGNYFTFLLVGTAVATFFNVALLSFSEAMTHEQSSGTLEALLTTPHDARTLLLGGVLWPFCFGLIQLSIYLLLGFAVFGVRVSPLGNLLLVASLFISLTAFSTLGLLAAGILVVVKRGAGLITMASAAFGILGGVMYPISVLPGWLQMVAHLLPITYGLDAVRLALAPRPDLTRISADLGALLVFIGILMPLAFVLFDWSINRARREGTLLDY